LGYIEQLRVKALRAEAAFSPMATGLSRIHPSPQIWFYRNKMEFSFGDVYPPVPGGPTILLGLKPKGRWYRILDLADCHLLSPEAPELLRAVRGWAEREALLPYNSRRHNGLLRHLILRESKNGPDRMVVLVTAPGEIPRESFLEAVRSVYPATTVLWGIHEGFSDTASCECLEPLSGPGFITESLRLGDRDLKFRVSPSTFFQTNTKAAELLYGILRDWACKIRAKRILDLYCGGGGITLSLASVCAEVIGAELNEASIEDARANAAANGIANAQFYFGAVERLLPALLALSPDVAVVDPPRSGLHPTALEALRALGPKTLFYVSCNPTTLERDLKVLKTSYTLECAEMVDFFPHTEHVETAVWLKRQS
jgi:23S rRNA (uracil1939-C5)-methyltransferase